MTIAMAIPDLKACRMPFNPNRQCKAAPRMAASAEGIAYRSANGRAVLDSISGL